MNKLFYIPVLAVFAFIVSCQGKKTEEDKVAAPIELITTPYPNPDSISSPQASSPEITDKSISVKETDTIRLKDYSLFFSPAQKTHFPSIFEDFKERQRVTQGMDYYDGVKTIEKMLLDKWADFCSVKDSMLLLKLDNGQTVSLPQWDKEKEMGHNLEHYFPRQNYYLVHVPFTEGNVWLLVNKKNGFKKYICGLPYFSPDGQSAITASYDLEAGYNFNGMEYLKVQGDSLAEEWRLDIGNNWGPSEIKWVDKTTALVKRRTFEEEVNHAPEKNLVSKLVITKK
jgi:hypothetical protein